jgi:protein phosphatase
MYRRPHPLPTRVTVAARSDIGPMRHCNEDACLVIDLSGGARSEAEQPVAATMESAAGVALAVIDGMGGLASGIEATRTGAEALRAGLDGLPLGDRDCEACLLAAFSAASAAIFAGGERDRQLFGLGATATLAVLRGDRVHLAHVGDTRAYVLRAGRLVQVTCDDSLLNEARAAGHSEEAISELPRNVVVRALGLKSTVDAASSTILLCEGDVLLLCSDGLTSVVDDDTIERALVRYADPDEACRALLRMAWRNESPDNITIVVARPETEGLRTPTRADRLVTPAPRPLLRG